MKAAYRQVALWISLFAAALIFSAPRCVAAPTAAVDTATSRIENATPLTPASNVAVTPGRMIRDDPPTREPGTKKRAQYIVGFGLAVVSLLMLIVGVSILRAIRRR